VNFPAGNYVVRFKAARRTNWGGVQTFAVYFDATAIGAFAPSTGDFVDYATSPFSASAGTHNIQFLCLAHDHSTDLIDSVRVSVNGGGALGRRVADTCGRPDGPRVTGDLSLGASALRRSSDVAKAPASLGRVVDEGWLASARGAARPAVGNAGAGAAA